MRELKMVIVPSETETRVWGRNASRTVKLRATLPAEPTHAHALPRLLEALGSFLPVHAAFVVPGREPSSATRLYPAWFADVGGDGYELQVIGSAKREHREWWGPGDR
jgi:hypothetical protein